MTWKEIKEKVEAGGVTDDMEMWYIDISFDSDLSVQPQAEDSPNELGFTVSN